MKKSKKILLILAVILIIGAAATFFLAKPTFRYRITSAMSRIMRQDHLKAVDSADLDLTVYTLDELLADSRVTFDQSLLLINSQHPIPPDFSAEIGEYNDSGVWMNTCVMDAYRSIAAAVSDKFDEKLYIMSAYRTEEEQITAMAEEGDRAAAVGESEHQVGLGLDVYIRYYAGAGFLNSDVGVYVNENCEDYGFIIRYPSYGTSVTGIGFEPWHLRYVGYPHAKIIADGSTTLEEYTVHLTESDFWQYEDVIITVQEGETFRLPVEFATMTVSENNMGGYVFTVFANNPHS